MFFNKIIEQCLGGKIFSKSERRMHILQPIKTAEKALERNTCRDTSSKEDQRQTDFFIFHRKRVP
jgi:hypothetical protein